MSVFLVSIVLAAWSNVPLQLPVANNQLTVQALEAVAQITPHAAGQRQIYAPKLSFSLRTRFACRGNAVPVSLSIGIADTLYRHVPAAGHRSLLATVEVPAGQIAPINIGNFCVAGHNGADNDLLLPGVATAQVSLHCDVSAPPVVQVTSVPLPLRLTCVSVESQDVSAATDPPTR
jgi:hypothetical protein